MKDEFGVKKLIIISILLSIIKGFLPIVLQIVLGLVAFIIAIIALMRSAKTKDVWLIFFSVIALILPYVIYIVISS